MDVTGLAMIGAGAGIAIVGASLLPTPMGAYLLQFGGAIALSGAASMLAPKPESGDPTMSGDGPLAQVRDPEQPRSLTYGRCAIGSTVTWIENSKSYRGLLMGWECVLCDHGAGPLEGVQFNDHYHPVYPADGNSHQYGIVSNSNRRDELLPSSWYTLTWGNAYRGNDESKKNDPQDIPHLGFRYRAWPFANQNEQWFNSDLYRTYKNRRRRYIGLTVLSVMQMASSTMDTTQMGRVMTLAKWKNDLYDPRTGQKAWTANAILVWMDFLKERLNLTNANFDMPNIVIEANVCDSTAWDSWGANNTGREPLYEIHGQVLDDKDTHDIARTMANHFMGGWHKRGDWYRPWTGHATGVLIQLGPDDFAGPGYVDPPPEEDWLNTLVPHYVPTFGENKNLIGRMIPVDTSNRGPVTKSTYRTEDGGEILTGDYKLEYCQLGRRSEYMAHVRLQELRAGNGRMYTREFKPSIGNVLEVGDVVGITDPDLWTDGERTFRVFETTENFDSGTFTIVFKPYTDAIYSVSAQPVEEPVSDDHGYLPVIPQLPYNPVFSWDTPPIWFIDLNTTPDQLSWGSFGVHVTDLAHPEEGTQAYSISGGAISWPGQVVYISYLDGNTFLNATTDPTINALPGSILLAFWLGGQDVKALFGSVFSDIGLLPDASIPGDKIIDLSANLLRINTFIAKLIHVGDPVKDGAARIDVDGSNKQIRIYDGQPGQNMQRVILGKLGTLPDEWGLEIYNRLGDLVLNSDGLDGTFIHDLTVDTIKVKNGAISNAWVVRQSSAFNISDGSDHSLTPIKVLVRDSTPPGFPPYVYITYQIRLKWTVTSSASVDVKVKRNGVLVESTETEAGTIGGGANGKWSTHTVVDDDPIVGIVTYSLAVNSHSQDIRVDRGLMFIQQIVK